MSKVRNKNTSAEQRARSIAHRMGLRFRLKRRGLPGKPDFVLPKYRLAVFVHGCFWHRHPGCKRASTPRTRAEFWRAKFETNVERDARLIEALAAIGWRSLVLWECEVRTPDLVRQRLSDAVRQCSQGASSS
jgi:DNA mismatch endonuclease (patch repair protein)